MTTYDVGRIRHDGALMHSSYSSNGSAVTSNWRLAATGDTGVTWSPESASSGSVSYASNSNDVTFANAPGASTLASRADHAHRGVTSLSHSSNTYTGPVTLETEGSLYIVRSAANTYKLGSTGTGGSGGGASVTDYVSGASGTGQIIIPGLAGSADIRVAATNDDEFDTTDTSDPMTGWTTLGTPTAHDINSTAKSHYYLKTNAAALALHGIYKTCPATPFTVTAKFSSYIVVGGNARAQLALLVAGGAGAIETFGWTGNSNRPGEVIVDLWTSRTAYNTTPVAQNSAPSVNYLRAVVTSSSNIQYQYSLSGQPGSWWNYGAAQNPGFTVGAVGIIGEGHTSGQAMELLVDYIRFT